MNTSADHAQTQGVALAPSVAVSAEGNTRAPAGSGKSLCGDLFQKAKRAVRFIQLCFIQRSISRAAWVDDFENFTPKY